MGVTRIEMESLNYSPIPQACFEWHIYWAICETETFPQANSRQVRVPKQFPPRSSGPGLHLLSGCCKDSPTILEFVCHLPSFHFLLGPLLPGTSIVFSTHAVTCTSWRSFQRYSYILTKRVLSDFGFSKPDLPLSACIPCPFGHCIMCPPVMPTTLHREKSCWP